MARNRWVHGRSDGADGSRGDAVAFADAQKQIDALDAARAAQGDAPLAAAAAGAGCPFSDAPAAKSSISRRGLLVGAASIAAVPLIGRATPATADLLGTVTGIVPSATTSLLGTQLPGTVNWKHAAEQRGLDAPAILGSFTEARFGRMFKTLPAFTPADSLLTALAGKMAETRDPQVDIPSENLDNPSMASGFIYLGQFIDHDMTHDTTPLDQQAVDPNATTNFESPWFDLSSMYGKGPLANPELYDTDGAHLLLKFNENNIVDLPREANGVAIVGDPRNDENLIICQLHIAFITLHNHFLDNDAGGVFAVAQQMTIHHYQWIIVHDFLPHVVGQALLDSMIYKNLLGQIRTRNMFYKPISLLTPYMPVEYSGAAYRWGHSGIRPEYETHANPIDPHNPSVLPIFDGNDPPFNRDLRGSRPLFSDAYIDWNYFYDITGVPSPDDRNLAHLIDTQVSRPLYNLPDSVVAHVAGAILALPVRTLLRGSRIGLPAGQDVAAAMRQVLPGMPTPLTNANLDPDNSFGLADSGWGGKAPLWFYCLRETELGDGTQLGPVMGRIVAEVILGLLQADTLGSYWNAAVPFTPVTGQTFNMGDMLKLIDANIIDPTSAQPFNTAGAFHKPLNELDPPRNPEFFLP